MGYLAKKHKIQKWMKPEQVELRTRGREYLNKVIELGVLRDNHIKSVKAFTAGETSVVFKVDTESQPFVVKMTTEKGGEEAEVYFLKAWEKEGVRVPQIYHVRPADDKIPTSVMVSEYITAPLLIDKYKSGELVEKGITRQLGRTLATMHKVKGENFGFPMQGNESKGNYDTFSDEIHGTLFGYRIEWLKEQGTLTEDDLKVAERAVELLEKDIKNGTKPSLTHNDFRPYNIFATDPITVFDPDCRITHPAICLAYTLLKSLINGDTDPREYDEILAGYREITSIANEVVNSALILRGIRKLHTSQRKGRLDYVKRIKKVLSKRGGKI